MAKRVITKLYSNPASPFARKIHVFLREAGMIEKVEIETVAGHPTDSGSIPLEANPLGKLPIMVLDDGEFVYDSRIITRYIDCVAQLGLYPDMSSGFRTHVLEAAADGIMDAAVLMVYEARSRAEDKIDPQWVEGQWARIERTLNMVNDEAVDDLNGELDAAHIAVACALEYLDLRHDSRDWRAGRENLATWYDAFKKRPSFQQ